MVNIAKVIYIYKIYGFTSVRKGLTLAFGTLTGGLLTLRSTAMFNVHCGTDTRCVWKERAGRMKINKPERNEYGVNRRQNSSKCDIAS